MPAATWSHFVLAGGPNRAHRRAMRRPKSNSYLSLLIVVAALGWYFILGISKGLK
jgi:hypothetical protein